MLLNSNRNNEYVKRADGGFARGQATEDFWQKPAGASPAAAATRSCHAASAEDLCAFACGRSATPDPRTSRPGPEGSCRTTLAGKTVSEEFE